MPEVKKRKKSILLFTFFLVGTATFVAGLNSYSKALQEEISSDAVFVPDQNNYWKLGSSEKGFVVCKTGYIAGPATSDPVKILAQKKLCKLNQKKYAISYLPILAKNPERANNSHSSYQAYQAKFKDKKYNLCKGFLSEDKSCSLKSEAEVLAKLAKIQQETLEREKENKQRAESLLITSIQKEKNNLLTELKQEVKREVKEDLLSEIYLQEELNREQQRKLSSRGAQQSKKKNKLKKRLQEKLAFLSSRDLAEASESDSFFQFKEKTRQVIQPSYAPTSNHLQSQFIQQQQQPVQRLSNYPYLNSYNSYYLQAREMLNYGQIRPATYSYSACPHSNTNNSYYYYPRYPHYLQRAH